MFASFLIFTVNAQQSKIANEQIVELNTDLGIIKVKLYNKTPLHRDNFIKLTNQGFYNGSIFHRVINHFMIQGGQAANGAEDIGYTIPAEIDSSLFHKKGALCAARMSDQVNPQRASSGSQFYIVQGEVLNANQLKIYGQQMGKKFSSRQIEAYSTIGGTPHLDGDYTVFGEVIEGLDIVDKIAAVQVNKQDNDKPLIAVKIISAKVITQK